MDKLHCMAVVVKVAEVGSFTAAARLLNISPPKATRAVAFLEAAVGAKLFLRSTRAVKLTEAGRLYVEDCRRILADMEEAEAAVNGSYAQPVGTLTVTAPVMFGNIFVMPVLVEFLERYPAVQGRALLFDRVANLVEEGVDVGVRIGHLPDSGINAIKVGAVRRVICGAPSYFERNGIPLDPKALSDHSVIATTGSSAPVKWRFGGASRDMAGFHPRLYCNNVEASLSAAVSGWGLAQALSYQVAKPCAEGVLKIVLEEFEDEPMPIHVIHPEGRYASAKTRAFVDMLVSKLRTAAPFDG